MHVCYCFGSLITHVMKFGLVSKEPLYGLTARVNVRMAKTLFFSVLASKSNTKIFQV